MSDRDNELNLDTQTVIIVDDSEISLRLLEHTLSSIDGLRVKSFIDPRDALEAFRAGPCDLLITDLQMPLMDGLALIEACHGIGDKTEVPIMVVSVSTERDMRHRALQLGAIDFLNKPLDAVEIRARTTNMLALGRARQKLANRSQWLAAEVRRATATIAKRERETILKLSRAAEYRDWETGQHILRMAEYTRILAGGLGLSPELEEELTLAAPLHDVGKIGIPDYILRKPDRLDPEEYTLMQRHTVMGHEILSESTSRLLHLGAEIALTHHEKWDGTGYPHRLAGEAIPLSGRIVAVADVFDAVTSRRPYKGAWPLADARSFIEQASSKHFDPACVEAFRSRWSDILDAQLRFSDDAVPEEKLIEPSLAVA